MDTTMRRAAAAEAAEAAELAELARQVREAFDVKPGTMTVQLARRLGVPERAVVAALPDGRARALAPERWEEALRALGAAEQVHVIVSSAAATLEAFGKLGGFSVWGDYLNVQSGAIDMHIRRGEIGSVYVVGKPSHMDGVETLSVQFFTHAGQAAFKVFLTFGKQPPTAGQRALADELVGRFGAA